jgi:hypothetical protein
MTEQTDTDQSYLPTLIQHGDTDYELNRRVNSTWISVNNLSVYIARRGSSLYVEVYPLGQEDDDDAMLCSCSTKFDSTME